MFQLLASELDLILLSMFCPVRHSLAQSEHYFRSTSYVTYALPYLTKRALNQVTVERIGGFEDAVADAEAGEAALEGEEVGWGGDFDADEGGAVVFIGLFNVF